MLHRASYGHFVTRLAIGEFGRQALATSLTNALSKSSTRIGRVLNGYWLGRFDPHQKHRAVDMDLVGRVAVWCTLGFIALWFAIGWCEVGFLGIDHLFQWLCSTEHPHLQ